MTTAVIYTRFSPRPNAKECDSCEKQEERCRAYCERKGYHVLGAQSDPDTTGGVLERLGLRMAIQQIDAHPEETILVVDATDRLARDMLVSLTIRYQVEKAGGRIEFANGTPVADTPEGRLFSNILAAFAAYERDRIRHATSRGIKRRQANGEWFGKPPCGWQLDPNNSKKLVEHPTEQDAIRRAIEIDGYLSPKFSSEQIAKILTQEYGLFRGKPWSARTVRRLLVQGRKVT